MCQSDVYLARGDSEELLMEQVGWVEADEEGVRLRDMTGEEKRVEGRLKYADLVQHKLVLEPPEPGQ